VGPGLALLAVAALVTVGCGGDDYPTEDRLTSGIFLDAEARAVLPPGVDLRKVSSEGLALTKQSEGFVSRLYHDAAGYCTIGYGHLLKKARCDGSEPSHMRGGIAEPDAAELLTADMEIAEIAVMNAVNVPLTDGQFAALADFVFNVGSGNFRRSTLLSVLNQGQHDRVPHQLRRWVKAGGREWPGLKTRREREIGLYFQGLAIPRSAPPEDEDISEIDVRSGE
jgi:GH24 family phage-related lysozyme (muramidase)